MANEAKEVIPNAVDWDALEDTSSEDEKDEFGSDSGSNDSEGHNHEEHKRHDHRPKDSQNHHGRSHYDRPRDGKYDRPRDGRYGGHKDGKYGGYRDGRDGKYGRHKEGKFNKGYNQGDPNGNYELYYKNDPDFFVKVIKQEQPPHEIRVKAKRMERNAIDYSFGEIKKIMAKYGAEECDVEVVSSTLYVITIIIGSDSETAAEVYAKLYDNVRKEFPGYSVSCFYQKETETLEKYADEAAAEYYKQEEQKKLEGYQEKPSKHDEGASISFNKFGAGGIPKFYNK